MRTVTGKTKSAHLFPAWLKSRRAVLAYYLIFIAALFSVYSLYRLPPGTAAYTALLGSAIGLGFAVYDFAKYVARHRTLSKLIGRFPLGGLPAGNDLVTADYHEIIAAQEAERLRLVAETERLRKNADQYYTTWAHQIKTPVAAMRLLLQKGGERASPATLEAELFRIEQYVDMVLQYQRLESLNADLSFQSFTVGTLVRRALKNLAPLFISKDLPLSLGELDSEIITDSKWFVFVVEQLLTNALKYTREGGVSIVTEDNTLIIRDTGIGIPAEDLPRVFELGYTGSVGRLERQSTGIGLYLCREISRRLGFTLFLRSQVGRGTEACIGLAGLRPDDWQGRD